MPDECKLELYRDLPAYQKLTPEQKVTADRWDAERIHRDKYITMLGEAQKTQNNELWKQALDGLSSDAGNAYMCEHERHWSSNCIGCNAIEKILRPTLYCKGENCDYPLEEWEVEKGREYCECCLEDQDVENKDED